MTEKNTVPQIDLDKVFKEKNPRLYKFLPSFVIGIIKKLIHQNDLNYLLKHGKGLKGVEFSDFVLNEMKVKLKFKGLENIPANGNIILASNHPLGGIDGIAIVSMMGKIRRDLKFIVNDILYQIPNYEGIFIPVNKHGVNSKSSLEAIENIYASQDAVLIFPAGFCSRKIRGKIMDINWNKSFITKSVKYNRDIVPVLINAQNGSFFYNLATFRKWIGLKINIEMMLLPHEMFKQRGKTIEIIIGKPVPHIAFKTGKSQHWADMLRKFIYELKNKPEADFLNFIHKNI
ncbi:MAG: 1-acyl-sn-glycerol-3-phosphate acyltransferase [Bacteroidetes bacterium]|nr:1-acyl-sn-glycerol-3-phosphate acyltransferase [Bacteroidota bacterium]